MYLVNNNTDDKLVELFDYNTVQVIYNDNINILKSDTNKNDMLSNLSKIGTNESNISSKLGKIDTNKSDISSKLEK